MLFAQALGEKGIADCLARPELLPLWRALGSEAWLRAVERPISVAVLTRALPDMTAERIALCLDAHQDQGRRGGASLGSGTSLMMYPEQRPEETP